MAYELLRNGADKKKLKAKQTEHTDQHSDSLILSMCVCVCVCGRGGGWVIMKGQNYLACSGTKFVIFDPILGRRTLQRPLPCFLYVCE